MRRYVIILLISLFIGGINLAALAVYLQPLSGDLTRLGWFSERDFGWNNPQVNVKETRYEVGPYDHYYDVVVVGDSFSGISTKERPVPKREQWQNRLAARSNLSVLTIDKHIDTFSFDDLFGSEAFIKFPPKMLIVEKVERTVIDLYKNSVDQCSIAQSQSWLNPVFPKILPSDVETISRVRDRGGLLASLNPGYARTYLLKNIIKYFGYKVQTISIPLSTENLFSSEKDKSLLFFHVDIEKANWRSNDISSARCGVINLRKRAEANGITKFVSMIAPDKLTIYDGYIVDKKYTKLSRLDELDSEGSISDLRLDKVLKEAVRLGGKDVYLPNDTHWGGIGHTLVAEAIMKLLEPDISLKTSWVADVIGSKYVETLAVTGPIP
ncbi:hypothetical protein [Methylomonas sp. MK1]|uniref:hypothetical protein n=1 Tax=Methylomonas sp. MK1 TaxID=1131552 RepID=UPI0003793D08|nr:hypothetical protein [Methylomonas sp. MK1]